MTIGTNIKKLRTSQGLTQDQLAEKLYVTRQTVSNWERGASRPDLEQLEAIAAALDTEVTALLYGPQPKPGRSRRRVLVTVLLGGALLALWGIARWVLLPLAQAEARTYVMTVSLFYGYAYRPLMALGAGAFALSLGGLRWNLALKKPGKRVCLVLALALLAGYGGLVGGALGGWLPQWMFLLAVKVMAARSWTGLFLSFLSGTLLFLAFNPPRPQIKSCS